MSLDSLLRKITGKRKPLPPVRPSEKLYLEIPQSAGRGFYPSYKKDEHKLKGGERCVEWVNPRRRAKHVWDVPRV